MTSRADKLPVPEGFLLARDHTGKYLVLEADWATNELGRRPRKYIERAGPYSKRFDAVQWVYRKQAKENFGG